MPVNSSATSPISLEGVYRVILEGRGIRFLSDPLATADEAIGIVNWLAEFSGEDLPRISIIQRYNSYEGRWDVVQFYRKPLTPEPE